MRRKYRIVLEAEMERDEFQNKLGLDEQGGDEPFDLMDSIIWEMDYGESATGGEPSTHNGIKISVESGDE